MVNDSAASAVGAPPAAQPSASVIATALVDRLDAIAADRHDCGVQAGVATAWPWTGDAWFHPTLDAPDGEVPEWLIDDAVGRVIGGIRGLVIDGDAQLDAAALERLAVGVEQIRRVAEAASVAVAERVDATNPFRADGFFNGKNWLRHRLRLTKSEAFRRVQCGRQRARLGPWTPASEHGEVGVAQSQLVAQIAANPRIPTDVLAAGAAELLVDAQTLSYDEFEARARRWESLADPDGAVDDAKRQHEQRDFRLKGKREGGWTFSGSLPELDGARFVDIYSTYLEREWIVDWDEATARVGPDATVTDLQRTEPQRRADALVAMAEAAAGARPDGVRSVPTLNVLCDAVTLDALLNGEPIPADRYRDVVCRTQSGRELHLGEAVSALVWGRVRKVLLDEHGTVINLGRKRRLFTGAAREAALLMIALCVWPGCFIPVGRLEVDHARSWKHHGTTDQDNASGMCHGHNVIKELGYRVERDGCGTVHVFHPDGHEIL